MMTSPEIRSSSQVRKDFLDFFKSKQHTIVPSSSLLPDAPNLLFTNAGMNQFVPIFLGQTKCPYTPGRAADTQKCIRAGGKHNDLDDVGLDTYHHTFFEMLGNWSFGDYFKKEAIEWAWELVVKVWKFPPTRLYATVYCPHMNPEIWAAEMKELLGDIEMIIDGGQYPYFFEHEILPKVPSAGSGKIEPSDIEAARYWARHFRAAGLNPVDHIIPGNKKDNFWMMGDTGPCGPCSELHVDLTPEGDTKGSLVNKGDARCIEIWNLVFIQFNAQPVAAVCDRRGDGEDDRRSQTAATVEFVPLAQKHVDTGMGFERVTSIIQGTKGFKDFANAKISNYETDIFRPIFDAIEKLSGKKYGSTLPGGAHAPSRVAIGAPPIASGEHTHARVLPLTPSSTAREVSGITEAKYSRRNLPHFERPWAKYMVTFSTRDRRILTPPERDLVLDSILHAHRQRQYQLYAACVMPDHVHLLFEPQIKEQDKEGKPVFWSLGDILQGIKSASAHNINKTAGQKGPVWEKESVDRMIRGQSDLEEKFHYICRNPWEAGVVPMAENYPWFWTPDGSGSARATRATVGALVDSTGEAEPTTETSPDPERSAPTARAQSATREGACAPQIQQSEQEKIDVAFRVIADHIRTLGFAIADGIQPGNTDRNYVLRRILRRAVRYGRTLGFHEPFFHKLVDVLADTMGDVFPEIRTKKKHVQEVIRTEEEAFNKTLDRGLEILDDSICLAIQTAVLNNPLISFAMIRNTNSRANPPTREVRNMGLKPKGQEADFVVQHDNRAHFLAMLGKLPIIPGFQAFELYDTYGFPLDLTELMARERGLTVDKEGFEKLMEKQRARARAAQKKEIIEIQEAIDFQTTFIGYETLECTARTKQVVMFPRREGDKTGLVTDTSPFYAEMGGQVGDSGWVVAGQNRYAVLEARRSGSAICHVLGADFKQFDPGINVVDSIVELVVDRERRSAIQRHHTVTHLFHWALHEVVSKDATQKGSYVGPDKLTFDFNSAPLMPAQVADVEKLVNERILENAGVSWTEVPYADVKLRKDVLQFFGDKYGDTVRVVQIGGKPNALDGYSMELCGGTHTRATGEIGLFRIVGESAIAAGVRRVEAVAGLEAYDLANQQLRLLRNVAGHVNSPIQELEKKIEALLAHQKELEKQVKLAIQRNASNAASELLSRVQTVNGVPLIAHNLGDADGDFLQAIADALKGRFKGVVVLGGVANNAVALVATVSPEFTSKVQAGKIIQQIAPIVGGKGGGKPDNARGGGKDASKLDEALAKACTLLT